MSTGPEVSAPQSPKEHVSALPNETGQNPGSPATVNSIPLNPAERALVKRDEARKRKAYLKALESDARKIVSGCQEARDISEQATALHRKFKDVVEEMRPVFERVREGFAHLRKGETVMGETTGDAWAQKHLGITYNWLCRCLNQPKAGKLLLSDGTKVLNPQPSKRNRSHSKPPIAETVEWTDNQYIRTCVRFIATTLKPLESDPQRFIRLAEAIAAEILGDLRDGDTARHEPAVGTERKGEFAPHRPPRNPWWSMTPDEKKQFAAKRLRERLAAKRVEVEQYPVSHACAEQSAVD